MKRRMNQRTSMQSRGKAYLDTMMKNHFKFTKKKRFKNIVFLFMSLLMTAGSVGLILERYPRGRHSLLETHIVGWMGLALFGGGFLLFLYRNICYYSEGRDQVMFTDEGLLLLDKLIPWNSIISVYGDKYAVYIKTNIKSERHSRKNKIKPFIRFVRRYEGTFVISNFYYDGSQEEFCEKIKNECLRVSGQK